MSSGHQLWAICGLYFCSTIHCSIFPLHSWVAGLYSSSIWDSSLASLTQRLERLTLTQTVLLTSSSPSIVPPFLTFQPTSSPSICLFFLPGRKQWIHCAALFLSFLFQVNICSSFPSSSLPPLFLSLLLFHLSGSEMVEGGGGGGGVLAGAPLPDCSPFTSHVSLQGLSLPPVCLYLSVSPLTVWDVRRLTWTGRAGMQSKG